MLTHPQLYLFAAAVAVIGFWLIPPRFAWLRQGFVTALSFSVVFTLAPHAALLCVAATLAAVVCSQFWRITNSPSLAWLGTGVLVAPLVFSRMWLPEAGQMASLGVAFFTLRTLGAFLDSYRTRTPLKVSTTLALNFLLPTYSSGPIENTRTFSLEKFAAPFSFATFGQGLSRMSLGLFKCGFVCNDVIQPLIETHWPDFWDHHASLGATSCAAYSLMKFLLIYTNFSGYSDIAIGTSGLFGLKVRENFNFPFLATNIQKFWQRWHMSLGDWVLNYLYFPMIRLSGRVFLPIVITFALVGVWHAFNWNYAAWGLAHGLGLGFVQFISRRRKGQPAPSKIVAGCRAATGWAATMAFVTFLSTFANAPSFEAGLSYARVLASGMLTF